MMELRKVCNHPMLCYDAMNPLRTGLVDTSIVRMCGKMYILDRLLVKLFLTGHRVLLFSTMTSLLDLLEVYLKWRKVSTDKYYSGNPDQSTTLMAYRRIDGSTPLEERESAIQDFNRPNTNIFMFLLSIRAAGRGLNLQSADTVIIYDPDANPKNEEQAIARAHRIGQTKEVRVIHFENVVDSEATWDMKHEHCLYSDSIESLLRNTIQKQKIEMASEVIDAGMFDTKTTNDQRKEALNDLLNDETRLSVANNEVPSHEELNAMIARSDSELKIFNKMDVELQWPGELQGEPEVPEFLRYNEQQLSQAGVQFRSTQRSIIDIADRDTRKRNHTASSSTVQYEEDEDEEEFILDNEEQWEDQDEEYRPYVHLNASHDKYGDEPSPSRYGSSIQQGNFKLVFDKKNNNNSYSATGDAKKTPKKVKFKMSR
eukprot:TRINITY_DN5944_c0_g3_i1.p1 TRINITY_DN5944_c0_g3~~TRINITY_DN5944_c0_g3_i1.p1  ORF type:complete len:428 (-),score=39.21 TRINITY_DN5944_c0_g3_i1:276-1559(-)